MGLDIRLPLGLVFMIIGGIMAIFGLATYGDTELYARSLNVNLNLVWGGLMFAFGTVMFFFGRRKKWQDDPVNPRPWEKGDIPPKASH
jgi:hypothetical protein